MPPPDLWSWNALDSARIDTLVKAWKDSLRSHFEEDTLLSERVHYLPDTTRAALYKSLRENKFRGRFFPRSFYRVTECSMSDSANVTKDTSVTVKLIESFVGQLVIRTDSATRWRKETLMGGMPYNVYDSTFSAKDTTLVLVFKASSERTLFLEPTEASKLTPGATRTWVLRRISGAARIAAPDDAAAPVLWSVQLVTRAGRRDTFNLRPDSLHFGVQRLYNRDSLLTYSTRDTISVVLIRSSRYTSSGFDWDPADVCIFLHLPADDLVHSIRRTLRPIPNDTTSFRFATPGLKQIYVELIPRAILTEASPEVISRLWGIPIQIKEAK
jgi:hypothetical protein